MSAPHIIRLVEESLLASEPVEYLPAPEKILSGHPRQRVWSHYSCLYEAVPKILFP